MNKLGDMEIYTERCSKCGHSTKNPQEVFPYHLLSRTYFLCPSCHNEWKETYEQLVKPLWNVEYSNINKGNLFDEVFLKFIKSNLGEKVLLT